MQISSIQTVSAQFTTDQSDTTTNRQEVIPDRTRQEHVRQLAQATKTVNQSGQLRQDRELTIALDRDSGQPVMRLVDKQTREVIQQIPEERVLRMAEEFKRASTNNQTPGGTDWHSTLG